MSGGAGQAQQRLQGVYDVRSRLNLASAGHGPQQDAWASASCKDVLTFLSQVRSFGVLV